MTDLVNRLIAVITGIAKLSTDNDVSAAIAAYANLIEGKERAGLERATIAGGIAAGRLEPQAYARAIGLAAAQDSFFSAFRAVATAKAQDLFAATMAGPAIDKFNEMRKLVEQGGLSGDFKGLDSKSWFDAATVRIDLMKRVEDGLAEGLASLMAAKKHEADLGLGAVIGLTLLALVYMIGPISGSHVNPAVTIGALLTGRIPLAEAAQRQGRDLCLARPERRELRTEGDHHEHRKVRHSIRSPLQQLQRGLVDPLRVFKYEKHWLAARKALELHD